jgi:hypothetical protein
MVSVPVRDAVDPFAAIENVAVPLPVSLLPPVTVIQAALLTAVQSQPAPAVTVALPVVAPAAAFCDVGFTLKLQGAPLCVTVRVRPAIVSVPVRASVEEFAAIEKAVVPLPLPLPPAVTLIQLALLTAVQLHPFPAVTVALLLLDPAAALCDVGLSA